MKHLLVLLALLLVFPGATAAKKDKSGHIDMSLVGVLRHVDDFGRSVFDVDLKGKPGKAVGRGVAISSAPAMYDELPVGNACIDFSPGPSGVNLISAQMVLTFKDGSMIWGNSPPEGYACFSGFAYAPYDIMGGSGRFEGATGWVVFEIDTYGFGPSLPRLVTPETGIATGEIILP